MAELAALGAAAAVAQFVDIAYRSLSQAKEIFQSSDGLTRKNAQLLIIAKDAQQQCTALLETGDALAKPDSPISELVKQCSRVASELAEELRWLQLDPTCARKRDRLRVFWRAFRGKDGIAELEKSLTDLRAQVCARIIDSLRDHQLSMMRSAAASEKSTREWNLATTKKLDRMARDLETSLSKQDSSNEDESFTKLAAELKSFADQIWNTGRIEAILKSLRFEQIRERQSRVETAHKDTFSWVFDQESPVNLAAWLRAGSGTYWIEGKAGSGKSTLMKYLLQHEGTEKLLSEWSGQRTPFIGSHFFWITGTDLQKSHIGLLRTMLFQLLKKHPVLVPIACPDRLSPKDYEHLDSWTMEDLIHSFDLLLACSTLPTRMCFFIDGLDEYSGSHTDLVKLLDTFTRSDQIKLCVSSRPWPEFRDAYGASRWTLCIHKFTRQDIYAFAHARLTENAHFEKLRKDSTTEVDGLMDEITSKSEGVFLWVYYVVRSLLRGLSNRDTIDVMYRRVREFPSELTEFFKQMFNAIEPVYKQDAACLLKTLAASDGPLPVMPLLAAKHASSALAPSRKRIAFATYTSRNAGIEDFATGLENISGLRGERDAMVDRYRDLIHAVNEDYPPESGIPSDWGVKIGFLHRTVVDFISTPEMDAILVLHTGPGFHPGLQLLKIFASGWENALVMSDAENPFSKACFAFLLRVAAQIHSDGDPSIIAAATDILRQPRAENLRCTSRIEEMIPSSLYHGPRRIIMDIPPPKVPVQVALAATLARMGLVKYLTGSPWLSLARGDKHENFEFNLRVFLEVLCGSIVPQDLDDGSFVFHERRFANVDALEALLGWRGSCYGDKQRYAAELWVMMLAVMRRGDPRTSRIAEDLVISLVASGAPRQILMPWSVGKRFFSEGYWDAGHKCAKYDMTEGYLLDSVKIIRGTLGARVADKLEGMFSVELAEVETDPVLIESIVEGLLIARQARTGFMAGG